MYIRFQSPTRDACSRVNLGIFQTAGRCLDACDPTARTWQHTELRRELDWFNAQLNAPARLFYRVGRRGERSGICWFRDDAREHVARARYMAWLIQDLGAAIESCRSAAPGTILWQDRYQIVALPASISTRRNRAPSHV